MDLIIHEASEVIVDVHGGGCLMFYKHWTSATWPLLHIVLINNISRFPIGSKRTYRFQFSSVIVEDTPRRQAARLIRCKTLNSLSIKI